MGQDGLRPGKRL
jgi:hypothetical protein